MRKILLIVMAMIFGASFISALMEGPAPTKEELASQEAEKAAQEEAKAKSNLEFQAIVGQLRALKTGLKNPGSFELVQAIKMPEGALCVVYRGTNSFNAVVTNHVVFVDQKVKTSSGDWVKYCADKEGESFLHARRAI